MLMLSDMKLFNTSADNKGPFIEKPQNCSGGELMDCNINGHFACMSGDQDGNKF